MKNTLKNIKSSFIRKIPFSFIEEKQKLKLVRYNKSLQKSLHFSINNYMYFQGKCKEYDSYGKGKEYGNLIFEGEYLNGERNGKGKAYDCDGNLIFEGEYLNGQRNGKVKEYYKDGTLKFEGEYLNDKRNRKGKEYYDDGK